ncbi:MAG: GGDEF domain-containing protein [Solirubrobacteraceae bacterium]|nr:GGDEF domain-containing protein [Solirubrobacteraceae bacterium]
MGKLSHLVAATREVLATRDLSTGLLKRGAFERAVDDWVGGGDARRPATSILMVQVGVKGAPLADRPDRQMIAHLAKSVTALLRATDIVGHVDADTIGILLPSTPVAQGTLAAERIVARFRDTNFAKKHGVAVTIGVASANTDEPELAALQALREARLAGGDRIVVAPERPAPSSAAAPEAGEGDAATQGSAA